MLTVRPVSQTREPLEMSLDVFASLTTVERRNAPGGWTLTAPAGTPGVEQFLTPGAGIEMVDEATGTHMFGGPVTRWRRAVTADGDMWKIEGVDDWFPLAWREAWPEPGTAAPPFNTDAEDVETGPVTAALAQLIDANVGGSAQLARQFPGVDMVVGIVGLGPTVTIRARWQNLADLVAEYATPHGAVVVVRRSTAHPHRDLDIDVRLARDVTDTVVFSAEFATLDGWVASAARPTATTVIVGGEGEGTARDIVVDDSAPPAAWPWRIERFADARSTPAAELAAAATARLAEYGAKRSLDITPAADLADGFRDTWDIGDIVAVDILGARVELPVVEVSHTLTPAGQTRTVSVGQADRDLGRLLSTVRTTESARLRDLERT